MSDFAGRTALVTGGSRGIGAAIVRALAERGADVAINYQSNRPAAKQTKTRRSIRAVPLQSAALDALDRLPETEGPLLFRAPHGGHIDLHNFRPRLAVDRPARRLDPEAPVNLLAVHEEALVE